MVARQYGRVVRVTSSLTAASARGLDLLGRLSMYRLVVLSLAGLAVVAFATSFAGLVAPTPLELVVTLAVLSAVCIGVDAAAQAILKLPSRLESSLITAHILLFVLRPTLEPAASTIPASAAGSRVGRSTNSRMCAVMSEDSKRHGSFSIALSLIHI